MADTPWWVIPTVVTGKPTPDQWTKGIYYNIQQLANPTRQIEQGQVLTKNLFSQTNSATFVAVDNAYYTKTFYTSGRDVLININTAVWIDATDTAGELGFLVDGVSPFPGTDGFGVFYFLTPLGGGVYPYHPVKFTYPVFDLAAGSHTFSLTHRRIAGTGLMGTATFSGYQTFYITEF